MEYHSERSKGRLGRLDFPGNFRGGVAFPVEVKIPSARIVRLVAGGMFVSCFSDLPVLNTFVVGRSTLWILPEMFMFGVRLSAPIAFNQRASNLLGTLNGENVALQSEGYAESGKAAPTPLKLTLPASIRSIR